MSVAAGLAAKWGEGDSYHPLICHMLDVASVAEALWDARLPPAVRQGIAESFRLDESSARTWVAFVAGLHDLGKASRPFQGRVPNHAELLSGTGLVASTLADPGHGLVTTAALPDLFVARGVPRPLAVQFAQLTGGHHGQFMIPGSTIWAEVGEDRQSEARAAWGAARAALFEALAEVLHVDNAPAGQLGNASAMVLAGLTSVADWIGSNTAFFEFKNNGPHDLDSYMTYARHQARKALDRIAWATSEPAPLASFEEVLEIPSLRPLQSAADAFHPSFETKPGLVIIESVMGEGKTEAALIYAERWREAGFPGMFIGLPTQATANHLHQRIATYLARRFPDDLVALSLAHGGAWLRDDLARLPEFLPEHINNGAGEHEATVGAGEWFASAKRALLAPFGVGTIDQSLFAVLQVRHVFVRLFGLAGKVVVLDEVHAYDTYMTELIERLLEWLAALDSPVILLSATLPSERRNRLLRAYDRGVHGGKTSLAPLGPLAYPSTVRLEEGAVIVEHPEPSPRSVRTLRIARTPVDTPLAELFERELDPTGSGVVICNTVGRAQQVFRDLLGSFDGEVLLFHSRFVVEDRQRIEADCLRRFGPDPRQSMRRTLLVATQVVEQSLDLDFDVMVTDIAPIDLLLQRSGRLWRHSRPGRTGDPVLHVRWPEETDSLPTFDGGTAAVYDPHILLRTWFALRGRDRIEIPHAMPGLVDEVYAEGLSLPDGISIESRLGGMWEQTWAAMMAARKDERDAALSRRLPPPDNDLLLTDFVRFTFDEDDPAAHPAIQALTRLGGLSAHVALLAGADLELAARSRLTKDGIRRVLARSVSVSSSFLLSVLANADEPEVWRKISALHRHRLVPLSEDGTAGVGAFRLSYDSRFGLEVL